MTQLRILNDLLKNSRQESKEIASELRDMQVQRARLQKDERSSSQLVAKLKKTCDESQHWRQVKSLRVEELERMLEEKANQLNYFHDSIVSIQQQDAAH
jgi:hypothetical protein